MVNDILARYWDLAGSKLFCPAHWFDMASLTDVDKYITLLGKKSQGKVTKFLTSD